ncbi:hypothetical protein JOQ06_001742 [Pogonophryne albipinna]|uniref:Uncharacterized protein n=1 Tax=Pogonophryne albipinna TaxID=1090488 RepID=A0AAD6B6I5_9TELE|nr:hypothetical protein JOQ06_001742 [Pogonophryne albipinna]
MMMIPGTHLLCLFLLAFPLSWAEDTKKDVKKKDNDTEAQVKRDEPCTSMRPAEGELLGLRPVLRPLRLLPLPTLQHHLSLLEDQPAVLNEDVDKNKYRTSTWT